MDSCSVFCFFKQKTAYEMRISDWRSDVCSSDLLIAAWPARRAAIVGNRLADALHMRKHTLHAPKASPCKNSVFQFLLGWSIHLRLWRQHCLFSRKRQGYGKIVMPGEPDRKSVVKGKSVSVRVDLGGTRIVK